MSADITQSLANHGINTSEYFAIVAELEKRVVQTIKIPPGGAPGETPHAFETIRWF